MNVVSKDLRDIYGEYDPPYNFNENPTKEEIEAAKKIIAKYEKLAKEKNNK